MTSTALPARGSVIAGYKIVRPVGEGGMGVVFEALDAAGRRVALKVLKPERASIPEMVRDFENEAEATGAVDHENVVTILGSGEEDGLHYILMEFVDGGPLHVKLAEGARLPWREAVEIVIQIARGLARAHSKGLIHRDVKPENILVFKDGRVRLTDFGIVKDISSLKGFLVKGTQVGTAAYASPEQCQGKRLDASTDMYSLGATLYAMICGRPPFTGDDLNTVMKKHIVTPIVPPIDFAPEIPKALSNAVEKMLAKKQTERYPTMESLIRDLSKIENGLLTIGSAKPRVDRSGAKPLPKPRRTEEKPKERKPLSAETVIVACLVAVLALVMLLLF